MPFNPTTLANLTPFPKGVSGNPAGRPQSAGSSVAEWTNTLASWPQSDVEAVLADAAAPMAQLVAARRFIRALNDDNALGAIEDRTEGRPKQKLEYAGDNILRTPTDRQDAAVEAMSRISMMINPSQN